MLCQRCEGLMEVIYVRYLMEEEFHSEVATTRCINCGNFENAVVRSNRTHPHKTSDMGAHTVRHGGPNTTQTDSLDWVLPKAGALPDRHHTRIRRLPVTPHLSNVRMYEDTHIAPSPSRFRESAHE